MSFTAVNQNSVLFMQNIEHSYGGLMLLLAVVIGGSVVVWIISQYRKALIVYDLGTGLIGLPVSWFRLNTPRLVRFLFNFIPGKSGSRKKLRQAKLVMLQAHVKYLANRPTSYPVKDYDRILREAKAYKISLEEIGITKDTLRTIIETRIKWLEHEKGRELDFLAKLTTKSPKDPDPNKSESVRIEEVIPKIDTELECLRNQLEERC